MVVPPDIAGQIEAHVAAGAIAEALSLLEGYEDLRSAEQPPLSKKTLKAVEGDDDAVRALVLGLAAFNPTVRGFCKKHVRRLDGAVTAGWLLRLGAECVEPLRASDNSDLLGAFGAFGSPVGQVIDAEQLETGDPGDRVAPAAKYLRAVADGVVAILAAKAPRHAAALREYRAAHVRAPDDTTLWGVSVTDLDAALFNKRKIGDELQSVLRLWASRELMLDDPDDEHLRALAARWCGQSPEGRANCLQSCAWQVAHLLAHKLPEALRIELYRSYLAALEGLGDDAHPMDEGALRSYRQTFPDELADREAVEEEQREKRKRGLAEWNALIGDESGDVEDDDRDDRGRLIVRTGSISVAQAISDVQGIATRIGLRSLYREFGGDPDLYDSPDDDMYRGTDDDAAVLRSVFEFFRERRTDRSVALAEVDAAEWSTPLDALLRRTVEPFLARIDAAKTLPGPESKHREHARFLHEVMWGVNLAVLEALYLLPEERAEGWAELWTTRVTARGLKLTFAIDSLADRYASRTSPNLALMDALMSRFSMHSELGGEILWRMYDRGDDAPATVARIVSRMKLPEAGEHYDRRASHDFYRALLWQAWQRAHLDLLATAMERCALPFGGSGASAKLVMVATPRTRRNYAPSVANGDGAPLTEVWRVVREKLPERAVGILDVLLPLGDLAELGSVLLIVAGRTDTTEELSANRDAIIDACEASNPKLGAAAFDVLTRHPELATDEMPTVVDALRAAMLTSSSALVKAAAGCASALALGHEDDADELIEVLLEALNIDSVPLLDKVLSALKRYATKRGKKPMPEALTSAVATLKKVAKKDQRRLGKHVDAILPKIS